MENTTVVNIENFSPLELIEFIEQEQLEVETLKVKLEEVNNEETALDNQIEELQEARRIELIKTAKELMEKKAELNNSLSAARESVANKRSIVEELESKNQDIDRKSNRQFDGLKNTTDIKKYNVAGTLFTLGLKPSGTFKSKDVTSLIKALNKLSTAEERLKVIEDLAGCIDDKGMARIKRKVDLVTVEEAVEFIEDTDKVSSSIHIIADASTPKNIITVTPNENTVPDKWFLDDWNEPQSEENNVYHIEDNTEYQEKVKDAPEGRNSNAPPVYFINNDDMVS